MEGNSETAPSGSTQDPETTALGAGGKVRRQPPRRAQATPYARPPQNQSLRSRLLSKLVDPAYRLLSGGSTRILPSLFSRPLTSTSLPPPPEPQTHVNLDGGIEEDAEGEFQTPPSTLRVSKTTGTSGTSYESKDVSDFAESRQGHNDDVSDEGLSEIEKLMKGKTFSREEIDRLIELLNSKAVDAPKVDQEGKDLILSAGGAKAPVVTEIQRSTEKKEGDVNKTLWGLETPRPKPTVPDEIGLSPIEIAKEYMGSRTSELNLGSKSIISKDERPSKLSDDFASETFVLLSSPKPFTGWPGSMVQDKRGYVTPQSQRGRFGLHNFPRTPYSRTIYSKSRSKFANVQDVGNGFMNSSFSPMSQSRTPVYGQLKSGSSIADDGRGSVGPIRRIRHKATADSQYKGSIHSHSSLRGPPVENSNVSKGLFPSIKKSLEVGGSSSSVFQSVHSKPGSSEMGIPPVHPHSSQMARTILEHLERNLATPKEKSDELKMATSWKASQSSDANATISKGQNGFPYLGLDSKSKDQISNRNTGQHDEDRGKSFSAASPESNNEANNVNQTSSASHLVVKKTVPIFGNDSGSSLDFGKAQDSQIKTMTKDIPKVTDAATSEGREKNSLGNKPVLASISVSKPEQRWMYTSDNGAGFTFPVSASCGVSSEPPTPSIMPSLSGNGLNQPEEGDTVPSYNFGSKGSTAALVFSFPSTSSASNHVDTSDIKFNFRSDRSSRLSFSSIGKNTVCY